MENKIKVDEASIKEDAVIEYPEEPIEITSVELHETPSEIRKFYEGATIFLTGGTGFLGKVMIEKILRTCPDISRIYLLVRPKKGKDPKQRFHEIFEDEVLFDKIRLENPKYDSKVKLIMGDCEQPNLGIIEEDRQILIDEVNIVFHIAATVKFNETIRLATYINVRGTWDLMELSKQMKNLKALVYVSTAFSNCILSEIDEVFYSHEMTANKLINLVDTLNDDVLETLTPRLIGEWPNTYTYTKAIAENVVRQYGQKMPVSILRPSIVGPAYKAPISGWTNNFMGPVGITLGASLGLLRTFRCNPNGSADIVPVDYCINATIASAWIANQYSGNYNKIQGSNNIVFDDMKIEHNIPIFNFISTNQKPLAWRQFMDLSENYGLQIPSLLCIWYYCFKLNPNKYQNLLYMILLHYIPGLIVDIGLILTGKKPKMLKAYNKIHKFSEVNSYFSMNQWFFKNDNTQAIWKKLNATDKRLFEFDISLLSWNEYISSILRGVRVYVSKDPMDTLPKAKRRYFKLKIAHYTIVTIYYLCLIKFVWMLNCSPLQFCGLMVLYRFILY